MLFLIVVSSLAENAQSAEKIIVHSEEAEKTDEEVAEEYEINSIFSELSLLVTKLNETMLPRMLQLIVVSIPYTSQSSKSRVVVSPRVHT